MAERPSWLTAANGVSLLRLALTVPVVWAMQSGRPWVGLVLFLAAAGSDRLDGYLARTRGEVSTLGKLLDPVADKALGIAVFAVLTLQGALPSWMFWALVIKESLLVSGGLLLLAAGRRVTAARRLGKVATAVLFTGLAFAIAGIAPGVLIVGAGVLLSLAAGVDYGLDAWRTWTAEK